MLYAKNKDYNKSNTYWKYITILRKYNVDLLHSITHNHEVSLINIDNECIKPKIDFNKIKIKKYNNQ